MATRSACSRVAITGIGLVTPLGSGRQLVWQRLLAGDSGIHAVRSFDTTNFTADRGAEVSDFDAAQHVRNLDPADIGRTSQMAIAATRQALEDAGLDLGDGVRSERIGVALGTTSGEPLQVEHYNDRQAAQALPELGPEFMNLYPCHVVPGYVAAEFGFSGVNTMIPAACAAGNYAIAHAFDVLRSGRADIMLAGGADSFSRITYTGFWRVGAIAPERVQPFDRNRKGMIPGEGAAMLVLEPWERAVARDATIYSEVAGYGLSCDAHHMTGAHPEGRGAARAMSKALAECGLRPEQVDYISAHGTGTPTNDRLESAAVRRVFGDAAGRTPMSSIKSMLGHTMGAASAIEAAVCALATYEDRVPPTMNFEEEDPDCMPLDCVPNEARDVTVQVAMNNAYAFGGNNASVLFRKTA